MHVRNCCACTEHTLACPDGVRSAVSPWCCLTIAAVLPTCRDLQSLTDSWSILFCCTALQQLTTPHTCLTCLVLSVHYCHDNVTSLNVNNSTTVRLSQDIGCNADVQGWKKKQSCGLDHQPRLLALLPLRHPLKGRYISPVCLPLTWLPQHTFLAFAVWHLPCVLPSCASAVWSACTDMHVATLCRFFVHSSWLIVCYVMYFVCCST